MCGNLHDHELDERGYRITNEVSIVAAATGSSGRQYFQVEQGRKRKWIPRNAFVSDGSEAVRQLNARGILIFGSAAKNTLVQAAERVTLFPPTDIMEQVGHQDGCFAYPDERVFSHDSREAPIAYRGGAVCVTQRGSLEDWQEHVLSLLLGQHLPLFAIFAAFAATLLGLTSIQGNFMFMYSGPPRKGKSTLLDVAASLCGPATDASGGRYLRKFNNTMNRIEELLHLYNDLPMLIDELSSMGSTRSVQNDFRLFVHHLAGVDGRGRFGDELEAARQTRTIYQFSSNDPLSDLLRYESEDAAAGVEDRIIEIPVPRGDEGIFNTPNPAFADTGALALAITEAVTMYHGAPMPAFLQSLVEHRAESPEEFQAGVTRRIEQFAELPEVTRAGRVSSRVLRLFGLIYVGGDLAKYYGIIPEEVDTAQVVTYCLGLHLGQRVEADPKQKLLSWFATNPVRNLRDTTLRSMSTARLDRCGAFVGECRGEPELWMRPRLFRKSFSDASVLLRQLKQRGILDAEGVGNDSHNARKRPVRLGPTDRVLVFKFPDLDEWLEANGYPAPKRRGIRSRR